MNDNYYISWWNLENLFDTSRASRSKKLRRQLASELKGWSAETLRKKIDNLAAVIRSIAGLK